MARGRRKVVADTEMLVSGDQNGLVGSIPKRLYSDWIATHKELVAVKQHLNELQKEATNLTQQVIDCLVGR